MKKLKYFFEYFKYLKNPFTVLAFKFNFKKKCTVKLKNSNAKLNLTSVEALDQLMNAMPTVKNDKIDGLVKYIKDLDKDVEFVVIDNIKYHNTFNNNFKKEHNQNYGWILHEYFCEDDWNTIDFKNRFVIDIGANVADRTLYFAKHGAKVIGFEPVKHLYNLGLDNISLNPKLKENITFINKAVGGKKGTLSIENMNSTEEYINQNDSYDIEVITINDILNDYNFTPDVLKIDCEGCEFEIILNEDLTMFNEIIFEHHSYIVGKDYNLLIDKLKEENFKIKTFNSTTDNFDDVGMIYAYK